ncbi:MAG TPA: PH domain-containing protein [Candidatus Bilamarchaeum sp.]|nr:PH domain-containing protein [Candidatus Bilamarchaeum sp.]
MAHSYHPFPIVSVISAVFFTAFLLVLVFFLRDFLGDFFILVEALFALIGFLRVLNLVVMAQTYTVTLGQNSITYSRGLFARKEINIRYSQVTEASYSQGVLQRIFGIATINVDTPGGSHMALHLADVRFDDVKMTLDLINSVKK